MYLVEFSLFLEGDNLCNFLRESSLLFTTKRAITKRRETKVNPVIYILNANWMLIIISLAQGLSQIFCSQNVSVGKGPITRKIKNGISKEANQDILACAAYHGSSRSSLFSFSIVHKISHG